MDHNYIVDKYIDALSRNIDTNPKFNLFRSNDPDFDKTLLLKEVRVVALENLKSNGSPNLKPYQLLDIMKNIKKSNEICKLLETNHAYITHLKEDGTLQYVFTNFGYRHLKNMNLL